METIFQNASSESISVLWQKVAIAILIGLLVGVERERAKKSSERYFAGIRTFPLISLFGFVTALISSFTNIFVFISGFLIFGILVAIEYFVTAEKGNLGGTTELTLLLVYILGGLVFWEYLLFSAALGVVITVFLSLKTKFRTFAGMIEEEDIFATLKFLIITIIVLPLLPNRTIDPFDILNPLQIWYFVILISAISFVGYIMFKIIGAKKGILLLSILGGLASSTAVTISFSQRSKENISHGRDFGSGILLATSVMYPRVLIIVFLLNSAVGINLIMPFFLLTAICIGVSLLIFKNQNAGKTENLQLTNPFRLLFALKFGLAVAVIIFVSSFANKHFGESGVFLATFIGGFASLDAAVLAAMNSTNENINVDAISAAVLIAIAANTIFKLMVIRFSGSKELMHVILKTFAVVLVVIVLSCSYYIFL